MKSLFVQKVVATVCTVATIFSVMNVPTMVNGQNSTILNMLRTQTPMQTFFIPMMEQDLIDQALKRVSTTAVGGRFMTMLAFSITTDYTIIWYDHQEEGYEIDILNPYQPATQIWGDMNAANGCSPMVTTCTNENDVLMAGQTLQIANFVDVSPRGTKLYFDGGDKVFASYPITVTRAGYSERPGSVLAGGVEVYDTEAWGTEYISPVGMTMRNNQMKEAFEISTAFITAKEQTQIIIDGDDTKPYYLGPGKSRCFNVTHQGMRFSASAKIQVSMVTGDVNSVYELRWFSLNPLDQWTNDYVTPVGDSVGKTKLVLYNADPINNVIATLQTLNTAKAVVNVSLTIPPESSIYSPSSHSIPVVGSFLLLDRTSLPGRTPIRKIVVIRTIGVSR